MKIIQVENKTDTGRGDCCTLDKLDLKPLSGADAVIYWYETAPYEGDGEMLVKKDGLWYYHGLDHCSCYGPTDQFHFYNGKKSPNDWVGSSEWSERCNPVLEEALKFDENAPVSA